MNIHPGSATPDRRPAALLVRDPEWPDEIRLALGDDGISF
jgi:hypothetical protein